MKTTRQTMTLEHQINRFLRQHLSHFDPPVLLAGDASNRVYYRVRSGAETWILCYDSKFPGSRDYAFIILQGILKEAGVPVPEIYHVDGDAGLILQEDLGDDMVEFMLDGLGYEAVRSLYMRIIDIMLGIQSVRGEGGPFALRFDPEKLMFEFDFFIRHALCGYFKNSPGHTLISALRREFEKISAILDRPDLSVLNHRDYHSRNIIVKSGAPRIIDFQDARMGLPHYDLVSLIRDSYVVLDDRMFNELKEYYRESSLNRGVLRMSPDEFEFFFDIQGFQRNVKAVGTFGYQVSVAGNTKFEKYIAPTLGYLPGYCSRQNELDAAWKIIRSLTGGLSAGA